MLALYFKVHQLSPASRICRCLKPPVLFLIWELSGECFYVDPTTLKPTFKNYYPGSITPPASGDVEAFVYDNPNQDV